MDKIAAYTALFDQEPGTGDAAINEDLNRRYRGYFEDPLEWARAMITRPGHTIPPGAADAIDWHQVLNVLSYHYATAGGHYFKLDHPGELVQ